MAMGKLGGEELNFSSDVDVCYFYSTDAGAAGEALAARLLRRAVAPVSRRRSSSRPATGWCSASTCGCGPRGATGRSATRSPRPSATTRRSAGPGSGRPGCARARRPAIARSGDELLAMLEPFIYPRSIDAAHGRRGARAAGAVPRSGRRGRRARRDRLRRQAGRGRHPRRRDGRAGAAAAARRQAAATCASATRRARCPRLVVAGLLGDREALDAAVGATASGGGSSTACRSRRARSSHRLPGDDEARAALRRAGWASPSLAAFDAEVRAQARGGRGDRGDAGRAARRDARSEAARLLDPLRDARGARAAARRRPASATPRRAADTLEAVRRAPAAGVAGAGDRVARSRSRAAALSRPGLRGSVGLMALLRDEPQLVRMLATLFGTSDRLSELLVRHPAMWEALVEGLGARVADARASCAARARGAAGATARRGESRRGDGGGGPARDPPLPGRGDAAHRPARRGRRASSRAR